jgi:peptidoglycan glycosyltransferase
MALVAAAIARDGELPRPYLVAEVRAPSGATTAGRGRGPALGRAVSAQAAAAVERGMAISVDQAYGRKAQVPGIKVAGKTGTAETGQGAATHAWFIGYAPLDQPRVAVAVVLESAGAGSEQAAPAAQRVLAAALAAGPP